MEKQTIQITELQVSELFEEQIFSEVHCVPSEYQVAQISTRPEVKFNK